MKLSNIFILSVLLGLGIVFSVFAHCDTVNGPVVSDAKQALEKANADIVLKWVRQQDEEKIKKAFNETLEKRKQHPEDKGDIDMSFYEEVVKLHRAGEGVEYSGIKTGEIKINPITEIADTALAKSAAGELIKMFPESVRADIQSDFDEVMKKKKHMNENIAAGREYVASYVKFMHHLENLYGAENTETHGQDKKIYHKH
ncbi:MAG: DUF6448 family protein [Candidatus Omnitrophica bacterium]|nr:DUF6448 family protein [Candidatus Omnitrophota bacterium]